MYRTSWSPLYTLDLDKNLQQIQIMDQTIGIFIKYNSKFYVNLFFYFVWTIKF